MGLPLEITLREAGPYEEAIRNEVTKRAEKLARMFGPILRFRVVVETPHKHSRRGEHYDVNIEISLPHKKIVVNREHNERDSHEDVFVSIRDAFEAAKRRLEDHYGRVRRVVKKHEAPPHGVVSKLFPKKGYGFIRTPDDNEVYFHKNSLLSGEFDRLKVGAEVRYSLEAGEKGPQASTVRLVGKHHISD